MKGGHHIIQKPMLIVFHYYHIVSVTIHNSLACFPLGVHGISSDDLAFQHQIL
jgi:hypothetical protein